MVVSFAIGAVAVVLVAAGARLGRLRTEIDLTIGTDRSRGRTPRKIAGKMYYLIPEKEWLRTERAAMQIENAFPRLPITEVPDVSQVADLLESPGEWN